MGARVTASELTVIAANIVAIATTGAALWRAQDRRLGRMERELRALTAYLKGAGVVPDSLDL